MSTVTERILSQAKTLPEGALISAKELLHLGSRAAVDQALKRLEQRKELMRLSRGLYVRPVETRFGTRAPAAEKVVASIVASHAETVVNHGAAAANVLGLTTQVPTKLVYLTSGRNRRLKSRRTSRRNEARPHVDAPSFASCCRRGYPRACMDRTERGLGGFGKAQTDTSVHNGRRACRCSFGTAFMDGGIHQQGVCSPCLKTI